MELLQLEYFLAVARLGNMTAAAEKLNVAQSSVSRSIARLERDLGVALFERSGRNIHLNKYGSAYYLRVERALIELSDGEAELKDMVGGLHGQVSLSVPTPDMITKPIVAYMQRYPDVVFHEKMLSFEKLRQELERGNIDFSLSYNPIEHQDFVWTPLAKERIYLLLPLTHPLCERTSVSLSELRCERFIMSQSDDMHYFTQLLCRRAGFEPNIQFYSSEPMLLGPMVEQGLGISLIPATNVRTLEQTFPGRESKIIDISDDFCVRTIGLIYLKRHYFSSASKRFYNTLVRYFRDLDVELNGTPTVFSEDE